MGPRRNSCQVIMSDNYVEEWLFRSRLLTQKIEDRSKITFFESNSDHFSDQRKNLVEVNRLKLVCTSEGFCQAR